MFRGPSGPHCVCWPAVGVIGPWPAGAPEISSCLRGFHLFLCVANRIAAVSPHDRRRPPRRSAAVSPKDCPLSHFHYCLFFGRLLVFRFLLLFVTLGGRCEHLLVSLSPASPVWVSLSILWLLSPNPVCMSMSPSSSFPVCFRRYHCFLDYRSPPLSFLQ